MKKALFYLIFLSIITLFLPYVFSGIFHHIATQESDTIPSENVIPFDGRIVIMNDDEQTLQMDFNEYLLGMVARNLISFDESVFQLPDFIRLNILLANTYLNKQYEDESYISDEFLSQYYISPEELRQLWGTNYDSYFTKISTLIQELKGQVLTYDNQIITPYYHFLSSGITRIPTDEAFLSSAPYLKSMDTNLDLEANGFLSIRSFENQEFLQTILKTYPDAFHSEIAANIQENIQIISRNLDYVETIQVGRIQMSGEAFAKLFSLNSPAFTLTFQNGTMKIITKGIGHGYGISLSYARSMIEGGTLLEDVIQYFYQNVEIKNWN